MRPAFEALDGQRIATGAAMGKRASPFGGGNSGKALPGRSASAKGVAAKGFPAREFQPRAFY